MLDSACLRDVPSKSVKNAKSQRSLAVSASPSNIMPKHYTGELAYNSITALNDLLLFLYKLVTCTCVNPTP